MERESRRQAPEKAEREAPNTTGIPTRLKRDFEARSGLSFDDVRVHYNSDKPARLGALAYTQGAQVYLGPGQERHLGHELGHVVQQKQGRVRPNLWIGGRPVNNSAQLEQEADAWGRLRLPGPDSAQPAIQPKAAPAVPCPVIQRVGERDAVNETFGLRRGNRRGSIVDTNFDSLLRLGALFNWFDTTFLTEFQKAYPDGSTELYFLMRAEAVKLAGVANCDDYATVTFAHIAQNTREQWVYRCHMEPSNRFHHAFSMTAPNELALGFLPAGTDIQDVCVVDGWAGYRISTLAQFCYDKKNPYVAALEPTVNVYIDNKMKAGSRALTEDEKAFVTGLTNQFLADYKPTTVADDAKEQLLRSPYLFGDRQRVPRKLDDIRPVVDRVLDMPREERLALFYQAGDELCFKLLDKLGRDEAKRADTLNGIPEPCRTAYLKFLWEKGRAEELSRILNNETCTWVKDFINGLPNWRLGLTRTKALELLDYTAKIRVTKGAEYLA